MSALAAWLRDGLAWGAEYADQLSNHLPMNLTALVRIGADETQCERFIASYTPRLSKLVADREPIADWRKSLGLHARNASYRAFFANELRARGRENVLEHYVYALAPGVSGGAFHPLIRLAFALEADADLEIAEALASWCMAYQELAPLSSASEAPLAVLASLEGPPISGGNTLFARLKTAASTPQFAAANGRIAVDASTVGRLAEAALAIYAASNNGFLALHLVTATHAARRVLAHLERRERLLHALAQSFVASYLVMGCPPLSPRTEKAPTWDAILDRARASTDDHDAKFCYALRDEQAVYGDEAYRREAARRMRLI